MYNVYVKKKEFLVITEIVHMNAGVNSEKENIKGSQSRSVTPSLDTHFGCRVGGVTLLFSIFAPNFLWFDHASSNSARVHRV